MKRELFRYCKIFGGHVPQVPPVSYVYACLTKCYQIIVDIGNKVHQVLFISFHKIPFSLTFLVAAKTPYHRELSKIFKRVSLNPNSCLQWKYWFLEKGLGMLHFITIQVADISFIKNQLNPIAPWSVIKLILITWFSSHVNFTIFFTRVRIN